jgi:ketosteroid isomerase-like protein
MRVPFVALILQLSVTDGASRQAGLWCEYRVPMDSSISDADVADLVQRVEDAAVAYIRGDIDTYLSLIVHADDYTLMPPFGGDTVRGFDSSPDALAGARSYFAGGDSTVELEQSYVAGDLAVLVVVEHQHGEVGGLPDQDWSLRVTLVFRRTASGWKMAHRHADPLTHPIGLEGAARLARGDQ